MVVYRCEDSLESIFTAVYRAYEEKRDHADTRISLQEEYWLFAEEIPVESDAEKAGKVMNTLRGRFGEEDFERICLALSSRDTEKAQAVYQTIVWGLSGGCRPGHLLDNLADGRVHTVFSLARNAGNEVRHLKGFVRFSELENGVLISRIAPKNNILIFLMPHFADRFPMENFMICDESRELFGIHPAGKSWYLVQGSPFAGKRETEGAAERENVAEQEEGAAAGWRVSEAEWEYQELFTFFCHKIAIKQRENKALQRNLLPLRFQEYMVEFGRNV